MFLVGSLLRVLLGEKEVDEMLVNIDWMAEVSL